MWGLWPLLPYRDAYTPMGTHPSRLSPGLFLLCVSISGFPGTCCLFSLFEKTFLHQEKYCEGSAHPACGEIRLLQGWREVLLARMLVIPSGGLGLIDGSLDVCLDPWHCCSSFVISAQSYAAGLLALLFQGDVGVG